MKMTTKTAFLLFLLSFTPLYSHAAKPVVHTVMTNGVAFHHFEIELSAANTLLPKDVKGRDHLDDSSRGHFDNGQFEVFIPAKHLDLGLACKNRFIVRMPMTLDADKPEVKRKQSLFYAIKKAVETGQGSVSVVLELQRDPYYACNLFFRTNGAGRYVDYVGKIKH